MQKTIRNYLSFRYAEIWKITGWKDGLAYDMESVGFIDRADLHKYPTDQYRHSVISTSLMNAGGDITLTPYLSEDHD